MNRLARALALALVLGTLWGCGQQAPELKDAPADGKPNPDLGPVTDIGAYQIQPPKGYARTDPKFLEPDEFSWEGPRRGEKDGAMFMVKIWPDERAEQPSKIGVEVATLTLDDYFSSALARVRPFWVRLQPDPPQRFTSHGLPFIGATWKAIDRESQRPFRGFLYVTLSGKQVVEITGEDAEPHHDVLLQAAAAAVRTLRKR